jgi:hypothetical protein
MVSSRIQSLQVYHSCGKGSNPAANRLTAMAIRDSQPVSCRIAADQPAATWQMSRFAVRHHDAKLPELTWRKQT